MKLLFAISLALALISMGAWAGPKDEGAHPDETVEVQIDAEERAPDADKETVEEPAGIPELESEGVPPLGELLLVRPEALEREPEFVEAPNELVLERVILRGAVVQWIKTDNPLQLFNPFAPERYGSGEQNLTFDEFSGRPKGMTIFSIEFRGRSRR
jgi:hypothetical protein